MPNFTENLNLQLQLQNEFYDVAILNENFKKIDAIDFEVEATKATFEELKQLVENKKLLVGAFYILTDYQCTYKQPNTDTIMVQPSNENIILTATSENTFSRIAFSDKYKEDIIYFTMDEILLGSKTENFRGCILRRVDTNNNINIPFDWRNIKLNRNYINIDDGYLYQNNPKTYKIVNELIVGTKFSKNELLIFYDKILMRCLEDFEWSETQKVEEKFSVIIGDYKTPIWNKNNTEVYKDIKIISNMQSNVNLINFNCKNIFIKSNDNYNIVDIALIEICEGINIKSQNSAVTIFKSNNIEIGYNNENIVINENCKNIEISYENKDLFINMNKSNIIIDKTFNDIESQMKANADNITTIDDKRKQGIKIIFNFYLQPDKWIAVSGGRYKYEFKENSITEESVVDVNFDFDNYDNAFMILPYTTTEEKKMNIWASSKPTNGLYCTIKIVNEVV